MTDENTPLLTAQNGTKYDLRVYLRITNVTNITFLFLNNFSIRCSSIFDTDLKTLLD